MEYLLYINAWEVLSEQYSVWWKSVLNTSYKMMLLGF